MKDQPLSLTEFSTYMASFEPVERAPVIAVGVSGGPDSMALVRLMDQWARDRGGRVIGLTLDHGLRDASAHEADQVGYWLAEIGIEHHTLEWLGHKPTAAIQETARHVRRQMLLSWCRDAGVLHLALAHHADDQAETYMMRLAHGSGPDGLAGMAMVTESHDARILRPMLSVPKARLLATLDAMGQDWVDDPSNEQDVFERIRVRKALAAMTESGAGRDEIIGVMDDYAQQRHELDAVTADVVMRSVNFHTAGYATVDATALVACGPVLGVRALSRVLWAIGGRHYPPARDAMTRLYDQLGDTTKAKTLGGCRLVPVSDRWMVCRELRNMPLAMSVTKSGQLIWDNRLRLELVSGEDAPVEGVEIRPLGKRGWRELAAGGADTQPVFLPEAVRYSLPALYHNNAIVQVPYLTEPTPKAHPCGVTITKASFAPREPVVGAPFPLA